MVFVEGNFNVSQSYRIQNIRPATAENQYLNIYAMRNQAKDVQLRRSNLWRYGPHIIICGELQRKVKTLSVPFPFYIGLRNLFSLVIQTPKDVSPCQASIVIV